MIRIVIERITETKFKKPQNFLTSKTPTAHVKQTSYGAEQLFDEKYEVREIEETRKETVTLLLQEVAEEDTFVLSKVVAAINNFV